MGSKTEFSASSFSPHATFTRSPFEPAYKKFERKLTKQIRDIKAIGPSAREQEKISKLFDTVIASKAFCKVDRLIDELPREALSLFFAEHGIDVFSHVDEQEKSFWLYCIEGAIRKEQPVLLKHLLSIFQKLARKNCEDNPEPFEENGLETVKILAQEDVVLANQFLFGLPLAIFENVLLALPIDPARDLFAAEPERFLDICFREHFSFFTDFLKTHNNDKKIQKGLQEAFFSYWLDGNHANFLSLLGLMKEEKRLELFASLRRETWEKWIEKPGETLFHVAARDRDPQAWSLASQMISIMPFDAYASLLGKKDKDGLRFFYYLQGENGRASINTTQGKILKALDEGSLSLQRLRSFLKFNLSQEQQTQLFSLISKTDAPAIDAVRRKMDEIKEALQKSRCDEALFPRYTLLDFATSLVEGSKRLSSLHTLETELIQSLQKQAPKNLPREELLQITAALKKNLSGLVETMIETRLAALEGKNISYDDLEPFFAYKLPPHAFMRLVGIARTSTDERVKQELLRVNTSYIAAQKLQALLERPQNKVLSFEELSEIIPNLPEVDENYILSLIQFMEKEHAIETQNLVARFRTLLQVRELEIPPPSHAALLREAYFIENTLPKIISTQDEVFRRSQTKMPHTIQVSPKRDMICILPRPSRARWIDNGSYKTATRGGALMMTHPEALVPVVRLVSQVPSINQELDFPDSFSHFRQEIEIMKHFGGGRKPHPGFNRLFSTAEYTLRYCSQLDGRVKELPRISLLVEPSQINFFRFNNSTQQPPTVLEKIRFAKEMIAATAALHAEGVIHGDLKPNNFILTPDKDNILHAQMIDFGFSSIAQNGVPLDTGSFGNQYNKGYYGSILYTPPELLGTKNFSGDHYKVDAFALGFMMCELYFRARPTWGTWIDELYRQKLPQNVFLAQKARVVQEITKFINETLAKYPKDAAASPEFFYESTMAMLLHPDPALRWNVSQALQMFDRYLAIQQGI